LSALQLVGNIERIKGWTFDVLGVVALFGASRDNVDRNSRKA
jgi:hypothetical protein